QEMVVFGAGVQENPEERAAGEIERATGIGEHPFADRVEVHARDGYFLPREILPVGHQADELPVAIVEGRTQDIVPVEDRLERGPSSMNVQRRPDPYRRRDVVGNAVRSELVQEPERPLPVRDRLFAAARSRGGPGQADRRSVYDIHRVSRCSEPHAQRDPLPVVPAVPWRTIDRRTVVADTRPRPIAGRDAHERPRERKDRRPDLSNRCGRIDRRSPRFRVDPTIRAGRLHLWDSGRGPRRTGAGKVPKPTFLCYSHATTTKNVRTPAIAL